MAEMISAILRRAKDEAVGGDLLSFWCPGCDEAHRIRVNHGSGGWTWDGNAEAPTFAPSIAVSGGADNSRCHSFVRQGQIEFLGDCTHALAGKTVPLIPWPAASGKPPDGDTPTATGEAH